MVPCVLNCPDECFEEIKMVVAIVIASGIATVLALNVLFTFTIGGDLKTPSHQHRQRNPTGRDFYSACRQRL
jgi:hypothetical protein